MGQSIKAIGHPHSSAPARRSRNVADIMRDWRTLLKNNLGDPKSDASRKIPAVQKSYYVDTEEIEELIASKFALYAEPLLKRENFYPHDILAYSLISLEAKGSALAYNHLLTTFENAMREVADDHQENFFGMINVSALRVIENGNYGIAANLMAYGAMLAPRDHEIRKQFLNRYALYMFSGAKPKRVLMETVQRRLIQLIRDKEIDAAQQRDTSSAVHFSVLRKKIEGAYADFGPSPDTHSHIRKRRKTRDKGQHIDI